MADKNICEVSQLDSMTENTNVLVEENGSLNKLNLHGELNELKTGIENITYKVTKSKVIQIAVSDIQMTASTRGSFNANWSNDPSVTGINEITDATVVGCRLTQSNGECVSTNYYISAVDESTQVYTLTVNYSNLTDKSFTTTGRILLFISGSPV